ncbi:hypothetical protein HHL16_10160 [Pseudoflavitalea sp. G-6-1-2]|uniref:hypothetical protein n=1 Tax=Pseudoflavitalea sp. G-6-1-2 TaxID=2728841 RepID=UPI00146DB0B4|nr:hypothetical protein [Pseudoflavitalea sp. G-6-1-2]NML21237.1 hypothetical protein [Pseudoflavitalea sp. G-6-1-2]
MTRWLTILLMIISCNAFAQRYLVEAETFQFQGGWFTEKSASCLGNTMLRVQGGKGAADALTVIEVAGGRYAVWVRSADFKEKQGTRLLRLSVDEQPMEEAGRHGVEGFAWEKVGTVMLERKQVLLRLRDSRKNFARCDAVLLTADTAIDPNNQTFAELAKFRTAPVKMQAANAVTPAVSPYLVIPSGAPVIAEIKNEKLRMRFVKGGANKTAIVAKTEYYADGEWRSVNSFYEDHKVYLLSAQDPAITFGNFFPSWNGSKGKSYIMHDGKKIEMQEPEALLNPFLSGDLSEAIPVEAIKLNDSSIEVKYITSDHSVITGIWSLGKNAGHVTVQLQCMPAKSGYYSMALAAFQAMDAARVTNVQLPPMFQYKRISPYPVMLASSMMQQPVAITETKVGSGLLSTFISGEANSFSADWGMSESSPMGFAIKNESNKVQPVAFAPVLGLKNSKKSAGQSFSQTFAIGVIPAGWENALEYISEQVYKVRDYRKQSQGSLTDGLFNMIDLVKNDDAAGWDNSMKGFYDIEADPGSSPTVAHAAPLAMLSTAAITRDEDFYLKRSLPTIEYTLSRSGYRWAKAIVPSAYNNSEKTLLLNPFNSQFTTAYYEGLNRFTEGANPWISKIALPDNKIRTALGYSVNIPAWVQELAAYKLTNNSSWLNSAIANADRFITTQVNSNTITPMGKGAFYNANFYAYWWDLPDLYEATNDSKYLRAAEYSAFQTIAGIRSVPQVQDSLQKIHPGNKYEGNNSLWWKNKEKFRLGFPRKSGDAPEKHVAAQLVSPVGLGFEQPFTYFEPDKTVRPVFMSSWAPHLLRLYQFTNREIFQTYARNAVIGRFTNYPGYYATGYTDITMQPDFPYKGPDVSSIYYHHIPAHLAFSWDYLITEAIQRSGKAISFPYSKQDGFVWFTNRMYGAGKGTINEDKNARLWMKRGLIELNTPEVNYITAISDDKFYVILLSESNTALPVTVKLSKETGVAVNAPVQINAGGKSKTVKSALNNHELSVSLSGKGISMIAIPLEKKNAFTAITPVKDGMKVIDAGAPWGKVFLFRIRSPFGWDSVYGFAETAPLANASVTISCNQQTQTKNEYPFEWSFYKLKPEEKAEVKLRFTSGDQVKEETIVLEGN